MVNSTNGAAVGLVVHPAAELFPLLPDSELQELAEDIRTNGQRYPVVTWRGAVVDGRNRLRACELVDVDPRFEEHEFTDDAAVARYVVSVNIMRRHLKEGQRGMLGARLEGMFSEAARLRQITSTGGASRQLVANLPQAGTKARDDAAALVNVSARTVQDAKRVLLGGAPELVAAADAGAVAVSTAAVLTELPKEEQAGLVARGEKEILAAAKKIRAERAEERRAERIEKLAEIAAGESPLTGALGRFPVIYADPPWRYEHAESESRAIENQYPTMDLDAICALPVREIATEDAVLFLWVTSPKLEEGMRVVRDWGFAYRTCMVWDKLKIGMGYYARQRHELLLIATRGAPPTPAPDARPESVIAVSRPAKHSQKPAAFAEIIERMYPTLPRVELFCRSPRDGWKAWGNQA
jgi:N6-adenosine-specific RNA methylase IME4